MDATSIAGALPAEAFPRVRSSIPERLTPRVNNEILCERAFIAITLSMAMFLSFVCYHALQSYGAM
jgi:hypothetical protein